MRHSDFVPRDTRPVIIPPAGVGQPASREPRDTRPVIIPPAEVGQSASRERLRLLPTVPAGEARGEEGEGGTRADEGGAGAKPRPPASPSIRSTERRRWSADLVGPATAGLVLHGAGGIGKSALAAEIMARAGVLQPGRVTAVLSGEVCADRLLAGLAAALRRHPVAGSWTGERAAAVAAAGQLGLPADHRMALLRQHVLGEVPVLVCLDDFDDNLSAESGSWTVADPALAALLADWVEAPQLGRLLITCRQPFTLPGSAGRALGWRRLGPLSRSGAGRLATSLPALGRLSEQDLDRAWRLLGGHPRAMEYLDVLLGSGQAEFGDLARRLRTAVQARTGSPVARTGPDAPTGLSPAAADAIALAAADLLFGDLWRRLSDGARDLLTGVSVYREPVGWHPLLLGGQPGHSAVLAALAAEGEAAGLLTVDHRCEPPVVFVHRWTASEMHGRLAAEGHGAEVADAHRRAAEYWRQRVAAAPQDRDALREAGYHRLMAGGPPGREQPAPGGTARPGRGRLLAVAAAAAAVTVTGVAVVTAAVAGAFPSGGPGPDRGSRSGQTAALAGRSVAVRDQAAAWIARQVSGDAIVACDPAMCAALEAHRVVPTNLLVLRPSAPDPLGSDVVVATAAVRSQFGGRLASVYAPTVLASFGAGVLRIDVRAVAPDGAAAYRASLAADLAARREAGRQLLGNRRITGSAAARGELLTGRVDPRLLITLAALAATGPVRVTAFTDSGPGAGPGAPLRGVELALPPGAVAGPARDGPAGGGHGGGGHGGGAAARSILAFVRAQRPPYRPARAGIVPGPGGAQALSIQFAAPSPVGLLETQPRS
jgi:hypothetical protein